MEKLVQDKEWAKKYMFGIAMILKKGLHINMIHTLNRPFKEILLGLENWIPLYMTGQVSAYYLRILMLIYTLIPIMSLEMLH